MIDPYANGALLKLGILRTKAQILVPHPPAVVLRALTHVVLFKSWYPIVDAETMLILRRDTVVDARLVQELSEKRSQVVALRYRFKRPRHCLLF